jgi:RNA polymerase sigma-70 factor (ECF subfamily)
MSPSPDKPDKAGRAPAPQPPDDDAQLVAALRAGDERASEQLVRAHGGRMLAVARKFLSNEEDARDAVQEAFLSAFKSIDRFQGQARLSTWLHRIVVNAALARLRSRRGKDERPIDDLLPRFLADGHQADPVVEWRDASDALLEREETRALVRDAIEQLPDAYRTVLLLRDIEGLETDETARLLGVTTGVVKTRLHRARQAVRKLLDPHLRAGSV